MHMARRTRESKSWRMRLVVIAQSSWPAARSIACVTNHNTRPKLLKTTCAGDSVQSRNGELVEFFCVERRARSSAKRCGLNERYQSARTFHLPDMTFSVALMGQP